MGMLTKEESQLGEVLEGMLGERLPDREVALLYDHLRKELLEARRVLKAKQIEQEQLPLRGVA